MLSTHQSCFDLEAFSTRAPQLADAYRRARPFPHAVLDGLLQLHPGDMAGFPPPEWDGWRGYGDVYQVCKVVCEDISLVPEPFASLIHALSQPTFLRALEELTGVRRLLPDPYLRGGGLHMSGPGGVLAPHTDFHVYDDLRLYRRVNVIVYLNEAWTEADGGCLELRAAEEPTDRAVVVPSWGRCVVFTTDDRSVHGFPVPVAEGRWRRSLALYYYTAEEATTFSGDATTHWREHGAQRGTLRRLRMGSYRALLQTSRAFSLLAHLANPNQGRSWWTAHRRLRR